MLTVSHVAKIIVAYYNTKSTNKGMGYNVDCVARGQVYQYVYSDCAAAGMHLQMMRAKKILGGTRERGIRC